MRTAKYKFRKQENREKAVYKLVMYPREGSGIKGSYTNSKGNRVLVIYGYYNKKDHGLQGLKNLLGQYKSKLYLALIYAKPNLNPNHKDFSEIIEKFTN